jgi:glycine/D-amino acid oxidase-like deaminating enzyme
MPRLGSIAAVSLHALHRRQPHDARTPGKAAALLAKMRGLVADAHGHIETAWSGFFGATDDGLPLIGRVPGQPRCFAAFGYGGNGITYSALAADILEALMRGESHPGEADFALDR